jgi:hypothetical protein
MAALLWHSVPRLDSPNKIWLLPEPVARWLGIGLLLGPLYTALTEFLAGAPQGSSWNHPLAWIVTGAGLLVGATGAFFRPGGLDLGRWFAVLTDYAFTPKRAAWRPTGGVE